MFIIQIIMTLHIAWVCGAIGMLAIFYILVMPMFYFKLPLHILVLCWSSLILVFCILSLVFNRRCYKDILRYNFRQFKSLPWFVIFVVLLILAQVIILVFFQHEDADDAFYVANATTAVATDSIFQFDPLSIPVDQDRVSGVCKTPQSGVIKTVKSSRMGTA